MVYRHAAIVLTKYLNFSYLFTYLLIYLLIYLLTYIHTYLLTYLLTHIPAYLLTYLRTHSMEHSPSSEANRFSASQEIPRILWNWMFITTFTSVRHLFLSWTSSIQFIPPFPTSLRSILILSSHLRLRLPSGLYPSGFPTEILYKFCPPMHATCPAHLILLDCITRTILGKEYRSLSTWTVITIIIIYKPFRKYVSNIPGKYEVKEIQKTAILGTAHILRKVLM